MTRESKQFRLEIRCQKEQDSEIGFHHLRDKI
jgi:hypothetical protein